MRKLPTLLAGVLSVIMAAPASATIIQVDASSIQGANVLFNSGTQTGTTVQGSTQSGTAVNFTGRTLGGGTTIMADGGQARVQGNLDASTSNPNDTLLLQSLDFGLASGGLFNNLEFNLFTGSSSAGLVSLALTDNAGQVFNFNNLALGTGSNFFGFQGTGGESIANVAFTTTVGIQDVRQIRLDQLAGTSAVPEPATWAMMLLGFAGTGFAVRRRRAQGKLLQIA